ncbi:DUF4956 domain-containing protein [Candidatus Izemoplasma sp. B36]|uniref:DUF4956 domain-containing protein n=1 Tax=Candidatus Izemoplasma sp. B36 TaxID=3242468 RepID=UPI003557F8CA
MRLLSILDLFSELDALELTIPDILLNLLVVLILSLWVLLIYKLSYQSNVYNKSFAMSLPVSALVTAMVIMAVSSNVILSLGMVGALSIVRFRTAIKNPLDTIFMFWAIGIGITIGANMTLLAVLSSVVIGLAILFVQALELFNSPYILIVSLEKEFDEKKLLEEVKKLYPKFQVRNKSLQLDSSEYTFELRGKKDLSNKIDTLKEIQGVVTVILLTYKGDYVV